MLSLVDPKAFVAIVDATAGSSVVDPRLIRVARC